jgi:outer membrane immunogenic protein
MGARTIGLGDFLGRHVVTRFSIMFIAAALTAGVVPSASAADMAVKAPPMAPAGNWTGPYVGLAGGYGWGHSNQTDPGIPCDFFGTCPIVFEAGDGSYDLQGGIIGGTLGYNWQQGKWLFGVEGDYSWADIGGSSNSCGASSPLPHACGTTLESLATVRARLGVVGGPTGNWLTYVTGGFAGGNVNAWDNLFPASGSDFRTGWTAGGGIELAVARDWSVKAEYLYVDLGSAQMFQVVPGVPETVSVNASIFRVGINHAFH